MDSDNENAQSVITNKPNRCYVLNGKLHGVVMSHRFHADPLLP